MLLGPAIALYADYFIALRETAGTTAPDWNSYPKPPASLWLTSLLLSIIPVGIITMLVMYLTGKNSRVNKASDEIQNEIATTIQSRIKSDKLRLVITDAKLNAARTLLALSQPNN